MNAQVKTPPVTFAEAFVKAQAAIKPAIKDATNPAFKSKYADLGAVWEAVRGPLNDNGFAIIQATNFDERDMWLETIILHTSGERMSGRYPLRPTRADPQGFGSALTYAKRYSIAAMLGVVADDDDDGVVASQQPARAPQTQREVIHTPKTMSVDGDVEAGVRNWVDKQMAVLAKAERLPDILQWQDEQEDALHRLLKKAPTFHRELMDYFQVRQTAIGKTGATA